MAKTKSAYVGLLRAFIILTIIIFISSLAVIVVPFIPLISGKALTMQVLVIVSILSTVLSVLWIGLLIAMFVFAGEGGTVAPAGKSRIIYGLCLGFAAISTILNNVSTFVNLGEDQTMLMILSSLVSVFALAELVMSIVSFVHAIKVKNKLVH